MAVDPQAQQAIRALLVSKALDEAHLRRRRRLQAVLQTGGAVVGLGALAARGGQSVARRAIPDAAKATKVAESLEHKTNTGLAVGAGIGAIGGLNAAGISRTEAGPKKPKAVLAKAGTDPLVRQYGLRGSPQGVDRAKRKDIWDARSKHLNRKRDRWNATSTAAGHVETAGKVAAATAGVGVAGAQLRDSWKSEHKDNPAKMEASGARALGHLTRAKVPPKAGGRIVHAALHGSPGFKGLAVGAAGAVTAAGAGQLRTHANKKARKASSASGGSPRVRRRG